MGVQTRQLSYRVGEGAATDEVFADPGAGAPDVPDELRDEIELLIGVSAAPGALSFSRLPDGGRLLCRAGDGRVQALHLPAGAPEPADGPLPVDAWHTPARGRRDTARRAGTASADLARGNATRLVPFLTDVRRLFGSPAGRPLVLAEADPRTVEHWIALACASLPGPYARALTFVTRTTRPHDAPQQILGIGPEAAFDREDPETLAHLYRVHDGLGGPGSPPGDGRDDWWARLTARLWLAGVPPEPAADGAGPFALAPLWRQVLELDEPFTAEGDVLPPQVLRDAGLWQAASAAGVLAALVERLTGAAGPAPGGGSPGIRQLATVCRELHDNGAGEAIVEPLALALARRRYARAYADGVLPREEDLGGIPLSDAARRRLRAELRDTWGPRVEKDLAHRLSGPVPAWAGPLELALFLGMDVVDRGADAVAAALPDPGQGAQAVALLDRLADPALDRRVLDRLGAPASGPGPERRRRVEDLLALAAARPQGTWLERRLEYAPLAVRFAVATVQLRSRHPAPGDGPAGGELFAALAAREAVPGGRGDARTVRELWAFVWPDGGPDRTEVPTLLGACDSLLLLQAGGGEALGAWLTDPDRFDPLLLDTATRLRTAPGLDPRVRATAELLVAVPALAEGRISLREAVHTVPRLRRHAAPLTPAVDEHTARNLAVWLARTDLAREPQAMRYLVCQAEEAVVTEYGRCVRRHYDSADQLITLAGNHVRTASLFHLWFHADEQRTAHWERMAKNLCEEVLGRAARHMDDARLAAVAARLRHDHGHTWEEAWNKWLARIRR